MHPCELNIIKLLEIEQERQKFNKELEMKFSEELKNVWRSFFATWAVVALITIAAIYIS